MISTPLLWVLLALLLIQFLALRNPDHLLARCGGSLLLLGLLLVASLPTPGLALRPLLLATTAAISLPLGWSLAGRQLNGRGSGRGYLVIALMLSLGGGLLVGLRPYPFEYPGDAVDYLNLFQLQSLAGPRDASCLEGSWRQLTYSSACTLWGALLQGSPLGVNDLLSGLPQRLAIALPIAVLGLGVFRLLRLAAVGAVAAGLYWLLILAGLGNQSIAFVVNHGLQGSALAAAVFVDAVMVLLAFLGGTGPAWRRVAGLTLSLVPFLYLQLRLHGAFAMLTLALLVPLMTLLGLRGLLSRPARPVDRSTAWLLLLVGLGVTALILTATGSWGLDPSVQSRLVLRWRILEGLGLPESALPGSYMLRSPATRPELLAVVSLLAGGWCLLRRQAPRPDSNQGDGQAAAVSLYREVASLYGLAIVMAFLLPPISHLYLNLPKDVIANHRLMWGLILVSPLPSLIEGAVVGPATAGWNRRRGIAAGLLAVVVILVLVPIRGGSKKQPQLFWSKTRHLLQGPSARADLLQINRALMPSLLSLKAGNGAMPVVLADELIGSALQGFGTLVTPIDPVRHYAVAEPRPDEAAYGMIHTDLRRLHGEALAARLARVKPRPTVLIQESVIAPYYTPYAEIQAYDQDAVPHIARSGANSLTPALLEAQGFRLWRLLGADGRPRGDSRGATYRIWIR